MKEYKRANHMVWDWTFHAAWTAKNGYQAISGTAVHRCREFLRAMAIALDTMLDAGLISRPL